ncbi:MAG: alpha/beta fold hydrolase, partial [Planctomycetota bacterium]|nr:alpha/beta fold hydrolase [Planctomycetota bacterium]
PIEFPDNKDFKPVTMKDLPDFADDVETKATKTGKVHVNGLLATINYTEFKKREPSVKEEKLVLPAEATGFAKPLEVRLFMQDRKAPLAVTLLGFGQASSDKLARAWQSYLYDAGCHVLSFDSLVRNNMNEATGHGVAGNFAEEAKVCGKIIEAVLAQKSAGGGAIKDQTQGVRLLGTSYGGLLALQLLREGCARDWPVDRVLVVSTPVNLNTAALRLDAFDREDRPFFGIFQLSKLLNGYTPKEDAPTKEEEALMRAGLGYVFHGDLEACTRSNVDRYDPDLPVRLKAWEDRPDQMELQNEIVKKLKDTYEAAKKALEQSKGEKEKEQFEQEKKALEMVHKVKMLVAKRRPSNLSEWNFKDYVFLLLKPYWKLKRGKSVAVTLPDLLQGAPNFVQVVVAADDPLNDPKELAVAEKACPAPRLLVLPHGGHLGFTGTQWIEAMTKKFFGADGK